MSYMRQELLYMYGIPSHTYTGVVAFSGHDRIILHLHWKAQRFHLIPPLSQYLACTRILYTVSI